MLISGSIDILMKVRSGSLFHKSPELTPCRCVIVFHILDHLMKGVNGPLKFEKECDNSTVGFLTEIGFGNNGNRRFIISDL